MDLCCQYLGLKLPHPFIAGASPLCNIIDDARRLEDGGAAAIVMESLFEEQITHEQIATHRAMDGAAESYAEATSYFPSPEEFDLGPQEYLERLRSLKNALSIPVIASLNGTTPGGWLDYARLITQAGADALELNVYDVATDYELSATDIEQRTIEMVRTIKRSVSLPIAVKLSPFYTCTANFAAHLVSAGANGLVLFNRFYQPDIDLENLEVDVRLHLSTPVELPLRLRWLAILSARLNCSFAATGGIHTAEDAAKAIMTGADSVQLVSALLLNGPTHLDTVRRDLVRWMEKHEYESIKQMRGSMNLSRCPDPQAYERGNYMKMLHNHRA